MFSILLLGTANSPTESAERERVKFIISQRKIISDNSKNMQNKIEGML